MKIDINIGTYINHSYCVSTNLRRTCILEIGETFYYITTVWTLKKRQLDSIAHEGNAINDYKSALKSHIRLIKIFTYLEERRLRKI